MAEIIADFSNSGSGEETPNAHCNPNIPAARIIPNAKNPMNESRDLRSNLSPRFDRENNPHSFIIHGKPIIIGTHLILS